MARAHSVEQASQYKFGFDSSTASALDGSGTIADNIVAPGQGGTILFEYPEEFNSNNVGEFGSNLTDGGGKQTPSCG